MSDKMREEFEARFPLPIYVFWSDGEKNYMNHGNPLACLTYRGRWEGWQASRAAIEVELPKPSESYGCMGEGIGEPDTVIDYQGAVEAIESLGLRVKP